MEFTCLAKETREQKEEWGWNLVVAGKRRVVRENLKNGGYAI